MPGIQVGTGATQLAGRDRVPYTVVEVLSEHRIVVQMDRWHSYPPKLLGDSPTHVYSPDSRGLRLEVNLQRDGRWVYRDRHGWPQMYFEVGQRLRSVDLSSLT